MLDDYVAVSELSGAIDRTKNLLWPFHWGVWLRIALIALFIGGGGFNSPGGSSGDGGMGGAGFPDMGVNLAVILAIVAVIVTLALLWMFIGSVLQFVFVDCLASGEIMLSRTFRQRLGKGARLLLFNIAVMLVIIGIIAAAVLVFFFPLGGLGMVEGGRASAIAGFILLLLLLFLVLFIPAALIGLFTTDFVVPVMIRDDCGVIAAWKTVLSLILSEWKQLLVYVVARFILAIAVGVLILLAMLLALLLVALPFVIIGVAASVLLSVPNVWLLLLLVPFLIIIIPVALLMQVPPVTFFRYYSLQVLGTLLPAYALLPEAPESGAAA